MQPETFPRPSDLLAGQQHERTRIVAMIAHRIIELRGLRDPAAVGARQELVRLMAAVQEAGDTPAP